MIDQAYDGIVALKRKALHIGEHQDEINEKVDALDKDVDGNIKELNKQNYALESLVA